MATPSPAPDPAAELAPVPAQVPAPPSGRVCTHCGAPVGDDDGGVNWCRRLTPDELASHVATAQARREQILLLADPQLPPVLPPLPTGENDTITLLACVDHAIDMDAASHIHQATCTAPNEVGRWGCDCTPEPHPEAEPEPAVDPMASRLPAHWQTGGA